jgi:hypothetical protein
MKPVADEASQELVTAPTQPSGTEDTPSKVRRRLVKTAWVAPVIVATALPRSGYAANMSGGKGKVKPKPRGPFGQRLKPNKATVGD